ncbi:hypothetical protein CANCADRAFT_128466 [Tortispora caseinolytica NRRL Y-17796]|uniref:CBS domain-containing protein n=1 Tax=Tortispora caseinolytica NRRL Y-17796 TaxID=767744 RepID=A0A1E4TAI3_9ASCO|nr:hypothetical protein CANCADRAFT_128466 [Tortispora caseinolytica NRRL Y-17796]
MEIIEKEQEAGRQAIRKFLQSKSSYDVLPVSFRLIVLDTSLSIKKSLAILLQNGIVSAPLWNSSTSQFAGLLTSADYINVIQYYYQFSEKLGHIEQYPLDGLRTIEKALNVEPPQTLYIHPLRPLYDACLMMIQSRARRIPLIDYNKNSEVLVSVLTQYRILKFVAQNCKETRMLRVPLSVLKIGTPASQLATASMSTPVIEVIHMLVEHNISSVPIVDDAGVLLNVYEAVDILTLIKGGVYDDLELSVGEALLRRPEDFDGVHTCTDQDRLETIMDTIRRSRLHRLMVVDSNGRLTGIVTLSDILKYLLTDD